MNTAAKGENLFDADASQYAAYLKTPEGRLRGDLTFANVEDFLPAAGAEPLRALDVGCGTGAASVRLARRGAQVTLLDSSAMMLDSAERAIAEAGLAAKATLRHGEAAQLPELFPPRSFDIILCHNLLEYVGDATAVLSAAARLMRGSSAILSLLVRNQAGEVLKAALQAGDLAAAQNNLDAQWAQESLYGGSVRLFTPEALQATLKDASLTVFARRGVRVISDYLPAQISRSAEYERIFELERRLGSREEFFGIARYLHYLARGPAPQPEVNE
jgi:S-adenosylmethionine-dependent methyltransferase